VAAETSRLFPQARILRWDSDTTHGKDAHTRFLKSFLQGEADILIGTQMIAKGLDFPGVSLVGVINADTDLNLPDFRAGERTFSLLLQVAGRAGRGSAVGRVIIQSYNPNHYVIQAVSQQDYQTFYNTEAGYRYRLKQPPFTRIIRLTVTHISDDFCRREAARLRRELADAAGRLGLAEISILGPAPAFFPRLRGHFRWHLLLKGHHPAELLANIELPQCWKVDVDPVGLE
jgi:primosomal protein N' (replication factor Y)